MNCKFCGYESEVEFKECPKCRRRVLNVFTDKKPTPVTRQQHNSDAIKGLLVGLGVSIITNALIIGLVFGVSILFVGFFQLYNLIGFIIMIGSYILPSGILGYMYNKLYRNLGLSENARMTANIAYFITAIIILSFIF